MAENKTHAPHLSKAEPPAVAGGVTDESDARNWYQLKRQNEDLQRQLEEAKGETERQYDYNVEQIAKQAALEAKLAQRDSRCAAMRRVLVVLSEMKLQPGKSEIVKYETHKALQDACIAALSDTAGSDLLAQHAAEMAAIEITIAKQATVLAAKDARIAELERKVPAPVENAAEVAAALKCANLAPPEAFCNAEEAKCFEPTFEKRLVKAGEYYREIHAGGGICVTGQDFKLYGNDDGTRWIFRRRNE